MGDSNIINQGMVRKGFAVSFLGECQQLLYDMRWLIALAASLILFDFWFGIRVSQYNHIPIRKSSACRRTLNKFIDYLCYIILAAILGKVLGEPYGVDPINIAVIVILLCCGFELDSIYSHICELHHIKKPISLWRLLTSLISFKFKSIGDNVKELGDNLSDKDNNTNKNKI